jgi:BirA family transcriptional regulator, biotin operon repressor / biotin---[acetyl-CoA-carboxylase] ligase
MEQSINVDAIKPVLHTRLVGKVIQYWAELDSTNATLSRLAVGGAEEGTVVIADAQSAGRGRIGKPWFSPPGVNLHLSVLLKPAIHLNEVRMLTLIGSLAIADALEMHGAKAQVKWPNDVLVTDKKIAGVLADVRVHEERIDYLILGMGINLNIDRPTMDRYFGEAAAGATSFYEASGHLIDRTTFATTLLERLEHHYLAFLAKGKNVVLEEWRAHSFLGRRVRIREEDLDVEGIALNLDEEGCLLVALDDGSSVRVREGEVTPL